MFKFRPIVLNQNTCINLDLFQFIKFAKNFDGVELNIDKIRKTLSKNSNIKDFFEILEVYGTKVESIYPLADFSLCTDRDFKTKVLSNLSKMVNYCEKLESNLIIATPSLLTDSKEATSIPKWRIFNRTRKRLEDLSKRASKEDINIGFEFINSDYSSVSTLYEAKEILKPLESQENLGYIIDTFYFAKFDVNFEAISDIRKLIYLIKLADFNKDLAEKEKRLFPSEGNFNFDKFHRFLEKLGYHRAYSIELSHNGCSEKLLEKFSTIFKY
ncbi:MAG: sugar phosphate isomerase/epimerase family protein [Promethearchaeota archaeon]